jgi:hypothetical protein
VDASAAARSLQAAHHLPRLPHGQRLLRGDILPLCRSPRSRTQIYLAWNGSGRCEKDCQLVTYDVARTKDG